MSKVGSMSLTHYTSLRFVQCPRRRAGTRSERQFDFSIFRMNFQKLKTQIRSGEIDTIVVACPDVFGRLVGKRFTGQFFLDQVAAHSTHGCNYLLTVNMEMDPMDGFKLANWERGYGDFPMKPDLSTLRVLPWQKATALVICDLWHDDGKLVGEAPRSVLRMMVDRLASQKL